MTSDESNLDEVMRLAALRSYGVLDSAPEQALEDLVSLAAQICEVPVAAISLVDEKRAWFKAQVGHETGEIPRELSFSVHALQEREVMVVPDTTLDPRFATNARVTTEGGFRFYAGAPLRTPDDLSLGALCVLDRVPRTLSPLQVQALRVLAAQVMAQLELRSHARRLAESERFLRTIIESEPECVKLLGPDGSLQLMNRAGLDMVQAETFEQVAGQAIYAVVDPAHRARIQRLTKRVFGGKSGTLEYEIHGLKGTKLWLETHAAPLRDDQGRVTSLLAITRDITARKRAEDQSRVSHERLSLVARATNDVVWEWHVESNALWWSENFQTVFGHPAEEQSPTLDTWIKYIHPDDVDHVTWSIRDAAATGRAQWSQEYRFRRHDGTYAEILDRGSVVRDADGKPVRMLGAMQDITTRKHAQMGAQHLAAIVESSEDAIFSHDLGGVVTTWNKGAQEIFGYEASEMIGESILRIIPEDKRQQEGGISGKIWVGGRHAHFETQRVRKDGRRIDVSITASPIRNSLGQIFGISKVARDITEKNAQDAARRMSEARYRRLFDFAPEGILVADADARYIDANPAICKMLGYTYAECIQLRASEIADLAEQAEIEPALQEVKAGGDHEREWRLRRKDGSTLRAEVIATQMPDGSLLSMVRDVTDRRRTEERFRRLVESDVQGIAFWNQAGGVTEANDAYLRTVGYTRADLAAGRVNWVKMTPPAFAEHDQRALREIAERGACTPYEKEYIRPDGTRVPVLVGAASFLDSPSEGVSFVVDLTERNKLEQQFLRVQRLESIGVLAGGIAHDLNNALGPIIFSLELLAMKFTDESSQELLSILTASARRGAEMVRQVLSFARGMEGPRMLIPVGPLVADIAKIANETFLKHVKIDTDVARDVWRILGNSTQLHQVLLNLCMNARDAMPGGGTIRITATNVEIDAPTAALHPPAAPGPYVSIEVLDTGSGMTPEILAKACDPFFTTKEHGKGTGLGLSTALGIIKSHGGIMKIESDPGIGSRFTILLPAQTHPGKIVLPSPPAEMPRGNGELILVVDDETAVRQIAQQTLESFGYRVLVAEDGAKAVELYTAQRAEIAMVFTDMMMPIMDGPTAIRHMREIDPTVRIVATSGLAPAEFASRTGELGIHEFLPKPYTASKLLKTLRHVLTGE